MAVTWTRNVMDKVLYPLMSVIGAEFHPVRVILAGHEPAAQGDRWIDILWLGSEPVALAAFASLRQHRVRIRYIRRAGGVPSTPAAEALLDQVERLQRLLINNANLGSSGYWLDGQIGTVNGVPGFEDLRDEEGHVPYIGAEIEWTCKINEVIS
jgi:hypothetical protein